MVVVRRFAAAREELATQRRARMARLRWPAGKSVEYAKWRGSGAVVAAGVALRGHFSGQYSR